MVDLINSYDTKIDRFKINLKHQLINDLRYMIDSEKL